MNLATMSSASACVRQVLSGHDGQTGTGHAPAGGLPLQSRQLGLAATTEARARGAKTAENFMLTDDEFLGREAKSSGNERPERAKKSDCSWGLLQDSRLYEPSLLSLGVVKPFVSPATQQS